MMPEDKAELKNMVEDEYRSYSRWAKWWSAIYHSSLYISAALGAGAALVLKLEFISNFQYQEDLAAGLAGFAAVVVAVTAAGGFDRKWRVTRASRNMLYQLKIDLSKHDVEINEVAEKLKKITDRHEDGITGAVK